MNGTAKAFPVIVLITPYKKQNSGNTNNYKRENADKDNGTMYLVPDTELKVRFQLPFIQP